MSRRRRAVYPDGASTVSTAQEARVVAALNKVLSVKERELGPMLVATLYGFCILLSYYILRPVRDEISSADRGNLQILWTAVFFVMLVAVPLYSAAVARFSRGVFIPLANRFFWANLVIFFGVLYVLPESARPWIDRTFYVWTSVFALFVVTVFWGFMADLFTNEQGRRLFGFIAVGASLGGIVGSFITAALAEVLPQFSLLLVAVVPLEVAAWLAWYLHKRSNQTTSGMRREEAEPIRGTALSGINVALRSPYLRKIAAYIALMTFASTVLYFQQAELIAEALTDRAARTSFFAKIDLATNLITIFTQAFVTAHVIRKIGIALSLAFVPAVACLGFFGLGIFPLLATLVALQVVYRAGRYSIAKPSREVLFTVVDREERYKSKAFLDAAIYRGGDLVSGWTYAGLSFVGLSIGAIALAAAPVAAIWAVIGVSLGRQQEQLASEQAAQVASGAPELETV
jgi:AAA family ATP:ADP antiporter